jgi:hypothetical protein
MKVKVKVPVHKIRKGDRFWNEYWNKFVFATTDAYRLDGTLDERYSATRPKPKVAHCSFYAGEWQVDWYVWEVGVNDGNGAGGGWSEVEHRYIEVEREA